MFSCLLYSLPYLILTFILHCCHYFNFLCFLHWKPTLMHYLPLFFPPVSECTSSADQSTQMDVFNHHFTVVFWLITSLKAYSLGWQSTVYSLRSTAWNSTHCLVCCKVDFIYSMAKQKLPTTKAECKQHPAAVLYVTVKTSVPEKRGGEFWNHNTRSKFTFDTKQNELGSRCHQWSSPGWFHGDGRATGPRSVSTIKGCKIRPGLLALNYQTV